MLACDFYVERELVGGRLPPLIDAMLARPRGDGHNAPKKEGMKQREDDLFDYKFTWVVGGSDKGWTFHYRSEHLPLSAEMSSLLAFLQLSRECPGPSAT